MKRGILGALAVAVAVGACDDGTGSGEPGTMSLYLTDAPGDLTQAIVHIERIELAGNGDAEGGGVVLMNEPFVTDLLSLSNDVAALVEDAVVPAGTYGQLRFIIPGACIEVEGPGDESTIYATDGFGACGDVDAELRGPSYAHSGLKVSLPGGATEVAGDAYLFLLDFDVSESFGHIAGNSGMWVMDPHIVATEVGLSASVTVELTEAAGAGLAAVGGSLADFQARLASEEEPVAFEDPDADGVWTATFRFLMPGSYEASVERQQGVAYDATVELVGESATVDVPSAGSATVPFQVTEASPPSS